MSLTNSKTAAGEHAIYNDDWQQYKDTETVEPRFVGRSRRAQQRINQFTLCELKEGQNVQLIGKDVLEFGAGHGRMATEFPHIRSYTGVEISRNLVQLGRDRLIQAGLEGHATLIASDCMTFDGPENAFDVVCSLGMFAYVDDPEAVLRKMASHLRPGGRLFIDVVHSSPLYNPIHRLCLITGIRRHKRLRFSATQLDILFKRVGLTNVKVVMREYPFLCGLYADWNLDWPLAVRNSLAKRSWMNAFGIVCFAFGSKPD